MIELKLYLNKDNYKNKLNNDYIEDIIDSENENNILNVYSKKLSISNKVIEEIIKYLKNCIKQQCNNEIKYNDFYSRIILKIYNFNFENKKINYSKDGDPHKSHIHCFNKNEDYYIRVKDIKIEDMFFRLEKELEKISEDI